jgi:hypothetical protein
LTIIVFLPFLQLIDVEALFLALVLFDADFFALDPIDGFVDSTFLFVALISSLDFSRSAAIFSLAFSTVGRFAPEGFSCVPELEVFPEFEELLDGTQYDGRIVNDAQIGGIKVGGINGTLKLGSVFSFPIPFCCAAYQAA